MKNIFLCTLFVAFLVGCNTKSGVTSKDLIGSYDGTLKLDSMPAGEDEMAQRTREMLKTLKLNYEFKEDGTGKYVGEIMGMKNEADIKWALQSADTLRLTIQGKEEAYAMKKTEKGIDLSTEGAILVLIKK